ncbi:MAG: hypothetical protein IJK84_03900, partial [Bacteroidales bacterium]|nr:hypothetical protein [Bacteroidales bacterium]
HRHAPELSLDHSGSDYVPASAFGTIKLVLLRSYIQYGYRSAVLGTGVHLLPDAHQMVHITWVHLFMFFFVHYQNVDGPLLRMSPTHFSEEPFLALARCGGTVTTANLQAMLGKKGPAIQPYRKRLIEAGVIEAPRRGELVFAVPYLSEYLLKGVL